MTVKHLYLAALTAVIACASGGGSGGPASVRKGSLLTAVEIAEAHADVNSAYDAVLRLRPNWLARKGSMSSTPGSTDVAQVFVDGQAAGDIAALRNIPAYYVAAVEYFDITQAGARFGIRAGSSGAIEVRMKKP